MVLLYDNVDYSLRFYSQLYDTSYLFYTFYISKMSQATDRAITTITERWGPKGTGSPYDQI